MTMCRHEYRRGRKFAAEKEGWFQRLTCRLCGHFYHERVEPPRRTAA